MQTKINSEPPQSTSMSRNGGSAHSEIGGDWQSHCEERFRPADKLRPAAILLFTDESSTIGFHATTVWRDCLARGGARIAARGQSHRQSSLSLKHRCGLFCGHALRFQNRSRSPGSELSRSQTHDHPTLPTESREVESHAQGLTAVRRQGVSPFVRTAG